MQLQPLQNKPDNPSFVVSSGKYVPAPWEQDTVPMSYGNYAQSVESINSLVAHAKLQALGLAHTLTKIKLLDESEIYPILPPLVPFFLAMGELNFDMPPKSSRRVTINITRKGRAKPEYFPE